MQRITVLVADMPQVQVDLVRSLVSRHPDLLLVEASGYDDLNRAIAESAADVLLVDVSSHDSRELTAPYKRALSDHPRLSVLAVESDAREGSLWELAPARVRLGEIWPARLVDAIRRVAHRRSQAVDPDTTAHPR